MSQISKVFTGPSALVFRTEAGSLIQTQIGVTDFANLLTAAHTAYGWLGGLEGAKFLLSKIPNPLSRKVTELRFDSSLMLTPITARILTSDGMLLCKFKNAEEAFGADVRTQLIGLTICALAHCIDGNIALQLFKECMLRYLFGGSEEMASALFDQLNDTTYIHKVINEGAARGLTEMFASAIVSLRLPFGDRRWLRDNLMSGDDSNVVGGELDMVGGLLKWLLLHDGSVYTTRSALVVQVAACLKTVGYFVGQISSWDGCDPRPSIGRQAVLLILGGTEKTDLYQADGFHIVDTSSFILHYRYRTVGAMLLIALVNQSNLYPELLQTQFEQIHRGFREHLTIRHEVIGRELWVQFAKASSLPQASSIARRIAAVYFPRSVELVASCYEIIANQEILAHLPQHDKYNGMYETIPESICLFRALSAAIVVAVVSQLVSEDFEEIQHSISLSLSDTDWLENACKSVDEALAGPFKYSQAVFLVAVIHCAQNPVEASRQDSRIIAWRHGIYAILPAFLMRVKFQPQLVHLRCIDSYLANVSTNKDGAIVSATRAALWEDPDAFDISFEAGSSVLESINRPWFGLPSPSSADAPIHLTFGRSLHHSDPDLAIIGRVGGFVVGAVSIFDVLCQLVSSYSRKGSCPGHDSRSSVMTVQASRWTKDERIKPVAPHCCTFVPVQGDDLWAIYLAGDAAPFGGLVAVDCLECTLLRSALKTLVIGYF